MQSDLLRALVGLKLAAQSENRSNINSSVAFLLNNNNDRSSGSIIVNSNRDHDVIDDNESYTIDQSQDLCKSFGRSVNKPKNRRLIPRETEDQAVAVKKPKSDNSRNKENKGASVLDRREKNKFGESSAALRPFPNNSQPETRTSSCSRPFCIIDDSGFDETKRVSTTITSSAAKKNSEDQKGPKCLNKEYSRHKYNGGLALQSYSSTDDRKETQTSSCSTYFSDSEDNCIAILPRSPNTTSNHRNAAEFPRIKTNGTVTRVPIENLEPFFSISLLLKSLEKDELTLQYMTLLRWRDTVAKEAVEAFVSLAESNDEKEIALFCRTEAINSIEKVYARYLKESNSRTLDTKNRWHFHFAILFTVCNSASICREFLNWFTSHLITPRSVKDLEDPEQLIDGLVQHDEARFVLTRLQYLLKKYAKTTQEKDYEDLSLNSEESPELLYFFHGENNILYVKLLHKFDEYAASNCCNFTTLTSIATRNLMLLERKLLLKNL